MKSTPRIFNEGNYFTCRQCKTSLHFLLNTYARFAVVLCMEIISHVGPRYCADPTRHIRRDTCAVGCKEIILLVGSAN